MKAELHALAKSEKHPKEWGRTIAACQSNYIPWKGYFEMINLADEFIIYDHVQYTRYDWRSRNLIKSPNGLIWLTIPITKTSAKSRIDEVRISRSNWIRKHLVGIANSYAKSQFYNDYYKNWLHDLYHNHRARLSEQGRDPDLLSNVNEWFIRSVCSLLEINTTISRSTDYLHSNFQKNSSRVERILSMCKAANADTFLVGPSARNYLQAEGAEEKFAASGTRLIWMDYSNYSEYPQAHPPFEHNVSIVDLILCTGPDARVHLSQFGIDT